MTVGVDGSCRVDGAILLGLSAPVNWHDEWCRVWDVLTEEDLDVTGDPVFLQACCASVLTRSAVSALVR